MPYRDIVQAIMDKGGSMIQWLPEYSIEHAGIAERDAQGYAKTYSVALKHKDAWTAVLVDAASGDVVPAPGSYLGKWASLCEAEAWCRVFDLAVDLVRRYDAHITGVQDRIEAADLLEQERNSGRKKALEWAKEKRWQVGA